MKRGVFYREDRKAWWIQLTYRHDDGTRTQIRRMAQVNTQRGAEAERAKLLTAVASGTYGGRATVPTLAELSTEFFAHVQHHLKASSLEFYRDQLRVHLAPAFGAHRVDRIVGADLDAFVDRLRVGRSVGTVNAALRTLRRLLRFAASRGYMAEPRIKMVKRTEAVSFRFLTFEEAEKLIAAGDGGPWSTLVVVGLRAGLRIGELFALRWEDVDLQARKLHVRRSVYNGIETTPKGGRSREVPLTVQAAAALKAHRHLRSPLVFCREDGSQHYRNAERKPLAALCRAAGLKPIGPHVLRHTFASHAVMRGFSLREVQEWLGHSSVTITERYAHLAPSTGNRLDALDAVQETKT